MKKKYNLALTPQKNGDEVVMFANKFSSIADKYLLGINSLPHVTLYQFDVEEKEIDDIWGRVCEIWEEKPINLEFNEFSCLTFDNNIYWVSLLPDKVDILHKMHATVADVIGFSVKKTFDPHMTLLNTKNKDYEKEVAKLSPSYNPVTDSFILTIGESDAIGQLTKIVDQYPSTQKNTYKI